MGLQAFVFVSGRSVSPHKVNLMRSFDATVFLVDGTYEDAYRLSEAACREFGWYSRNTGHNPLACMPESSSTDFGACGGTDSNLLGWNGRCGSSANMAGPCAQG